MKKLSIRHLLYIGILCANSASPAAAESKLWPGLLVTEYPRHEQQTGDRTYNIPLEELGDPIGEITVATGLSPWHHTSNRNAIAYGYLQIAADGDYTFGTDSFYDRNLLMIDGKLICEYADGGNRVVTVPLKKGRVEIVSVGFVDGRGAGQGIEVRWRPPGQRELSPIPEDLLKHEYPHRPWQARAKISKSKSPKAEQSLLAKHLVVVAKDFVIDVYHNGERVPDDQRKLLLDRFGASAERVNTEVSKGDWLVFHVAHNRLRHGGSKFFAAAGMLDTNEFGFVSDLKSEHWSVCDDPAVAAKFIAERNWGLERRPSKIKRVWEEGMGFMRRYSGPDFKGGPLWGEAPATWIKFTAGTTVTHADILSLLEGSWTFTTTGNLFHIGIDGTVYGGKKNARVVIVDPARRIIRISDHLYSLSADGMQLTGKGLKGGSKHPARKRL